MIKGTHTELVMDVKGEVKRIIREEVQNILREGIRKEQLNEDEKNKGANMKKEEVDKLIDTIKDKKLQMDDTSIPSISNNAQELMCNYFCKYRENLTDELLDELCYYCPMGWLN